jgi:hypothetical protein
MTTTMETLDQITLTERWITRMQQEHPQIPAVLLRLYAETEVWPDDIAAALGCDAAIAADWDRVLTAHLLSAGHYEALFAAEDAVSERRVQWSHYQEDCRATAQRLADLQREIEGTLAYSHLGEEQASEVKARLEALDAERVDLLRHQADLPGVGRLIEAALETAHVVLGEAEGALQALQQADLQEVEESWLREALALCDPLRRLLHQAHTLDQAWERLGTKPSTATGRGRLKDAVLAALRK